jgi:hypothetical protein
MEKLPMRYTLIAVLLALSACGSGSGPAGQAEPQNAVVPVSAAPPQPLASPPDPLLQSQPIKDAIYRALTTRENQRWTDGKLTGWAVPSLEALPNGCRTIRYTVDQQPDMPIRTINACDATPGR